MSKNQKEAVDTQAYVDAGFTPDQAQTLPPQKKKNILVKLFKDKFDIAVKFEQGGKKLEAKYAIDQLLDAYRGIRFMGHVLGLPRKAFSLESTLSLVMEKGKGVYLGMYDPTTKSIHMPDRSNAFAHEWFHALDHFLKGKMKPQSFDSLTSHVTRNEGLDPRNDAQSAFINLVHKIFFDETDLALKVLSLETQAEKKTQAGTPTKEAQEAAIQLERLHAGMTRIRIKPSEYRAKAKNLDKGSGYWSSAHEMLARAFEAYTAYKVEKAGGQNAFITKGDAAYLSHADARLAMTFPKGTLMQNDPADP